MALGGAAVWTASRLILRLLRSRTSDLLTEDHDEELSAALEGSQLRSRRLREHISALRRANRELQAVNRNYMKTMRFVTHELKAPLAAIEGLAGLLVKGSIRDVSEDQRYIAGRIKRNTEDLQDMVKNYLDLARAERGELNPNFRHIDFVADVLEPAVSATRPLFDSRSISLYSRHPAQLPCLGDPELLRIALVNYLSNAAKYSREGNEAVVAAAEYDGEIQVSVWNQGIGFKPEERARLFKKFSRLRNRENRDKRGSGLGIYLAKEIIEKHGGQVDAKSAPGQWADFTFRLPTRLLRRPQQLADLPA